jgi:hypothetical protein
MWKWLQAMKCVTIMPIAEFVNQFSKLIKRNDACFSIHDKNCDASSFLERIWWKK